MKNGNVSTLRRIRFRYHSQNVSTALLETYRIASGYVSAISSIRFQMCGKNGLSANAPLQKYPVYTIIVVMDAKDSQVFLTDKYGTRNRTGEIKSIFFDSAAGLWKVCFSNSDTLYSYKKENVKIVDNCLKDKKSETVFEYLVRMAEFSDIKNKDGENLLVKNLAKTRFINEHSALARYLNPSAKDGEKQGSNDLIFPFGCNASQLKAVRTAMQNQISIIQGPPGTGKTQTILNIIANLLMDGKTVLVVSNNNSATSNVYEKLSSEKYGLGFLCATHGKYENIEQFLKNQRPFYPDYLNEWENKIPVISKILEDDINALGEYFSASERLAVIKSELSAIETEQRYFEENRAEEKYSGNNLLKFDSEYLMELLQNLQFNYDEKERLGFFCKMKLRLRHKLGARKFWQTNEEAVLSTIKSAYYEKKETELRDELYKKTDFMRSFNPDAVYEKCLDTLKRKIAVRFLKNKNRRQFKDSKEIYFNAGAFANEYPIVLSTTFSSRATIGGGNDFLFDCVIMDEASQVDVVTGAMALSCAKSAVIVGDKMQLPNVIEENKKALVRDLFLKANIPEGYDFNNSFLRSLEMVLPETPQTLLREHYRCHPKIINFCNQQFYGGKLIIMTEDKGEDDVLEAFVTVPGNFCTDRYNQRQIDVIKNEILPKYSEKEIENLGIIAPYNNQVNQILTQISGVDAATVHKYQGREKDAIIISTVDNEITDFADDPNLLNVAVSRAKRKLAVVLSGNEHPADSNISALVKYIKYNNFSVENSKVNSIFDFLYTKATAAKIEYLRKLKKISPFDSENAAGCLLEKIFSEPEYSKYGFVFEMPLKDIARRDYITTLPMELRNYAEKSWTHVDFAVFNKVTKEIVLGIEVDGYTYHKRGTRQAERDIKKNTIFELFGIPLLRLSTKGSNEEFKIKRALH